MAFASFPDAGEIPREVEMNTLCLIIMSLGLGQCPGESMNLSHARIALTVAGYEGSTLEDAMNIVACEQGRWYEYHNGVAEEDIWFPSVALGDGGLAVGLFQIHPLWVDYHHEINGETLDRADPVENAILARTINDYDMVRYGHPWEQWSCKWAVER